MLRGSRLLQFIWFLIFLSSSTNLVAAEESDSSKLLDVLNKGHELYDNLPDSAIKYYELAIQISDSLEFKNIEAQALYGLAKSLYIKADYDECYINFSKGLLIHESLSDTSGIIYGLNGCGIALTMLSKEEEAIDKHKQAIALCQEINDSIQLAKNLHNIAVSYESLQEFDLSLSYVDWARSICIWDESRKVLTLVFKL